MFEPVSRGVSQDVFRHHSVIASKYLDSYSMFDWGRMPDGIPHRGKFQAYLQAFVHLKISSPEEWKIFLRSPDALVMRKNAPAAYHFNELADSFPMKSSHRGVVSEVNFHSGNTEGTKISSELIQQSEQFYLLSDLYAEEKVSEQVLMGKTVLDFKAWKNKTGPKALPFEFECVFLGEFPLITLRCLQNSISTEITFTEALLITDLPVMKLEEACLRAAWIAAFIQFQIKQISPKEEQKLIRVRFGVDDTVSINPFVFLGSTIEFTEIEAELQKYYSSTVWGKVVLDLQQKAKTKGFSDWKRYCSEPAPWLDQELKNSFSNQYQKMISGITSCLSE